MQALPRFSCCANHPISAGGLIQVLLGLMALTSKSLPLSGDLGLRVIIGFYHVPSFTPTHDLAVFLVIHETSNELSFYRLHLPLKDLHGPLYP